LAGLREVPENCPLVAVHDGARPLVESADIERVLSEAETCGGALLGVLVKDTVKEVSPDKTLLKTLPRENLFLAQTPQVFNPGILKMAIESVMSEGLVFTDDSSYVEYFYSKTGTGGKIKLVEGNYENIKITTPEDLQTAQGIVSSREF
jgi:2-C-methyl-D-erythritol 4-phosphate cytidylyltransferase